MADRSRVLKKKKVQVKLIYPLMFTFMMRVCSKDSLTLARVLNKFRHQVNQNSCGTCTGLKTTTPSAFQLAQCDLMWPVISQNIMIKTFRFQCYKNALTHDLRFGDITNKNHFIFFFFFLHRQKNID